jgi:hypothetical protein
MTRRGIALALAGVVTGGAIIAIGVLTLRHGHSGAQRGPSAPPVTPSALSSEGRELVDLMKKGLDATYHARYQSFLADPRAQGTQMTMDVWRKGERTRQEVAVQAQNAKTRSGTFELPPHLFQCSQVGDGQWTCQRPSEATAPASPEIKVNEELGRGAIAARGDTIGGVPVRCFTFPAGGDLSETCLMRDGVVARLVTPSSHFELMAFSPVVPDDVFTLPAVAE